MMIEMLMFSLLAGVALGIFFFAGLWWTVRRGLVAKNPAAWFLISFILRMGVALGGFYWIAQLGEWQYLATALLGFIITRMVLTRVAPLKKEAGHAS
jgi:F1F0 ATPase subunit 2